jgi:hypothetical protein
VPEEKKENQEWLTVKEAAKELSCDSKVIQALIKGLPAAHHEIRGYIINIYDLRNFTAVIGSIKIAELKLQNLEVFKNKRNSKKDKPAPIGAFIRGSIAAKILGISAAKLERLIEEKKILGRKKGRGYIVESDSLYAFWEDKDNKGNNNKKDDNLGIVLGGKDLSIRDSLTEGAENIQISKEVNFPEKFDPPEGENEKNLTLEKLPDDNLIDTNSEKKIRSSFLEKTENDFVNVGTPKTISIKVRKGMVPGQKVCSIEDVAAAVNVSPTTVLRWINGKQISAVSMPVDSSDPRSRNETFIIIDSLKAFMLKYRQTEIVVIERIGSLNQKFIRDVNIKN